MAVWTLAAFSWLCLLSAVFCFSIEGVDDSILFKIRWKEPLHSIKDVYGDEVMLQCVWLAQVSEIRDFEHAKSEQIALKK